MRFFYLLSALLLGAAFIAAAAEMAAHADPTVRGIVIPAHDVLAAIAPETLARLRHAVTDTFGIGAWETGAMTVLALPGWLLFGLPGGILFWYGRRRTDADEAETDSPHALFDELARDAEQEGYTDDEPPAPMRATDITPAPGASGASGPSRPGPPYDPEPPLTAAEDTQGLDALDDEVPTPFDPPPPLPPGEPTEDDTPPYDPDPATGEGGTKGPGRA